MYDMMNCFMSLEGVSGPAPKSKWMPSLRRGPSGKAQKRLGDVSQKIVGTIRECGILCDTYRQQIVILRIAKVFGWRDKFSSLADKFKNLKNELQQVLTIYMAHTVQSISQMLSGTVPQVNETGRDVREIQNMMKGMFAALTRQEYLTYQVYNAVGRSLPDDGRDPIERGADHISKDKKQFEQLPQEEQTKMGQEVFVTRLKPQIEDLLRANVAIGKKLDALQGQLTAMSQKLEQQNDQVIRAVKAGPHDRILDGDVRFIWQDMGWKGSVRSKNLVLALRDYYVEEARPYLGQMDESKAIIGRSAQRRKEDMWALRYLTLMRVQPLLEALDDDFSSYVTISEVNSFTSARPPNWSLPLWLTYWAYGSELTVKWYFFRIRGALHQLWRASNTVLPVNRNVTSSFIQHGSVKFVERLLSGFSGIEQLGSGGDWESNAKFIVFKDYVQDVETNTNDVLRTEFRYEIDDISTLDIIGGRGRPEKALLPIVFILVKRAVALVRKAQQTTISPEDLHVIERSLGTVIQAVNKRMEELRATWKIYEAEEQSQLDRFFFGLYSNADASSKPRHGAYWDLDEPLSVVEHDAAPDTELAQPIVAIPESPLSLDPQIEDSRRAVKINKFCDVCGFHASPACMTCIKCSATHVDDTLDFCTVCFAGQAVPADTHKDHDKTHPVLQQRMPVMASFRAMLFRQAQSDLDDLRTEYRTLPAAREGEDPSYKDPQRMYPMCRECQQVITTTPFWNCIDCRRRWTYICQSCNAKFDEKKPWLHDGAQSSVATPDDDSDSEHRWWHNLVSVLPQPINGPPEEPSPSMHSLEDQLRTLTTELAAERQEAVEHRTHFAKLVRILRRFATPDVIEALEQEMPEIRSSATMSTREYGNARASAPIADISPTGTTPFTIAHDTSIASDMACSAGGTS